MSAPKLSVTKAEGAGNDFIFVAYSPSFDRAMIPKLCDRNFGVGADGLVLMEALAPTRTRWHFYNRDGSDAAMCGNAARAAAAWLQAAGKAFPHELETAFGPVTLNRHEKGFAARVQYAERAIDSIENVSGKMTSGTLVSAKFVDTGVPHAVVEWPSSVLLGARVDAAKLKEAALALRWAPIAGAAGTNVTFYSRVAAGVVEAVSFERGVEDFTLACGTGVLAAAVISSPGQTVVEVRNPGAALFVEAHEFPKALTLAGPARIVFTADVNPNER